MQAAYGSRPLTLIKTVPTRWLSHGNASKRVLDRYVEIIATLDAVYQKKQDTAVLGILQELLTPIFIATLCFLTDIVLLTNNIQLFLQA